MTPADREVHALGEWLAAEAGAAVDAALAVASTVAPAPPRVWQAVLARHRVAATSQEQRRRAALTTGQIAGAPADELHGVLLAIGKRCRDELDRVRGGLTEEGERRWDRLIRQADALAAELTARYRRTVLPERSMFAGAMASAQHGGQAVDARPRQSFISRCRRCRGPRLDERELRCAYCDAPLGG